VDELAVIQVILARSRPDLKAAVGADGSGMPVGYRLRQTIQMHGRGMSILRQEPEGCWKFACINNAVLQKAADQR
jgi:hypothetical protein